MKLMNLRLDKGRLLSARELFLAAIVGLLPDADMLLQKFAKYVLRIKFYPHRIYTHNLVIPLILLVIGLALYYRRTGNRYASTIFFLMSAGWAVHVALDFAFAGPVRLLAPFDWALYGFDLLYASEIINLLIGMDAILLIGWLFIRWWSTAKIKTSA